MKSLLKEFVLSLVFVGTCLLAVSGYGSDAGMKAPMKGRGTSGFNEEIATSSVKLTLIAAIRMYQENFSRLRSGECGFRPSCSRYGVNAVADYGPFTGLMMTGDRLIRCNYFKGPRPDYMLLPGGKLLDMPSKNVLAED
jgi:uncharacterized protein